jgi:hypothetical protein
LPEDSEDEILDDVHPNRRTFVKRVVAVTAFATPMVASYDLQSLSPSVAEAQTSNVSNVSNTFFTRNSR